MTAVRINVMSDTHLSIRTPAVVASCSSRTVTVGRRTGEADPSSP